MSNLSRFMKQNKAKKDNTKYVATTSLTDEHGKPLEWEIQPLTTKENEALKETCTLEVPIPGKPNLYRQKIKANEFLSKMIVASVVFPDLKNAELQDSYNVSHPEDLLKELIDAPGEYDEFAAFIQKYNGFAKTLEEKVDEAKN